MREYKSGVTHSNTVRVKLPDVDSDKETADAWIDAINVYLGISDGNGDPKANECRESSRGDSKPFDKSQCKRVKTGAKFLVKVGEQKSKVDGKMYAKHKECRSYIGTSTSLLGNYQQIIRTFMVHCNKCGKDFEDREVVK